MDLQNILTNEHISTKIVDIIRETKKFCFLVTPYFKPWTHLVKTLEIAASEDKKIIFLFRHDQQGNSDIIKLNTMYGFDIFFVENLHAKIYLNECTCLFSSMNLYDYSMKNNFEVGNIIRSTNECKKIADKIVGEMIKYWSTGNIPGKYFDEINKEIISGQKDYNGLEKQPKNPVYKTGLNNSPRGGSEKQSRGTDHENYCIRCGTRVPYGYKMCADCYSVWNTFGNTDYTENYCLNCGREADTTYDKPYCDDCYFNNRYMSPFNEN